MEEMLNGDMHMDGETMTASTMKQGMTASLEEFTRPSREDDTYGLYEDSEPLSSFTGKQTKRSRLAATVI